MGQVQGWGVRAACGALAMAIVLLLLGGAAARAQTAAGPDFTPPPSPVRVGDPVTFTATIPNPDSPPITSVTWDFGDGSAPGSGTTVQHAFASPGQPTVTLTVTRRDGTTAQAVHPVDVYALPVAAFTATPPAPIAGDTVAFDASASSDPGGIASYAWDFGDGTTGSGVAPSHQYPTAGDRTVTLTTTSALDGRTATSTQVLHVDAPPVAAFAIVPSAPKAGDNVAFFSTATDPDGAGDIASIAWDLDADGVFDDATGTLAQAVFLTAGSYVVAQRVTDQRGAVATTFQTVEVARAPVAAPAPVAATGVTVVPAPGEPAIAPTTTPSATPTTTTPATTRDTTTAARRLRVLTSVRVRLSGTVAGPMTTIASLAVVAPKGATIAARCAGQGCPPKALRVPVRRTGAVRLAPLQRQLAAGARITIDVTKKGYLPKRIVLTIRTGRAPTRVERCLVPTTPAGHAKVAPCPAT